MLRVSCVCIHWPKQWRYWAANSAVSQRQRDEMWRIRKKYIETNSSSKNKYCTFVRIAHHFDTYSFWVELLFSLSSWLRNIYFDCVARCFIVSMFLYYQVQGTNNRSVIVCDFYERTHTFIRNVWRDPQKTTRSPHYYHHYLKLKWKFSIHASI